jgi:hypothetical protein
MEHSTWIVRAKQHNHAAVTATMKLALDRRGSSNFPFQKMLTKTDLKLGRILHFTGRI